MNRPANRQPDQLREITFEPGIAPHANGSVLCSFGNTKVICAATIEEDVEFTFLLTNDYYVKKFFDRWQGSVIDPESNLIAYDAEYKTDVFIQQLDKQNTPVYGVRLKDAFPTAVNSIELSNETTDAVQAVSVTMTYDRFEVEGAVSSLINSTRNKFNIFRRLI